MAKLIFVIGPTASGKSDLALHLAQKFSGCIVNIDSVQVYKSLVIGAATPSLEDQKRVPHYLYSYVQEPHEMTAGQYLRDFYKLLQEKSLSGPVFVVGGTGFYFQALEKGMFDVPQVDEEIKQKILSEFDNGDQDKLYQELIEFDPETKVHANDHYRIGRALEVKRAFGLKMSELQSSFKAKNAWPDQVLKLGLTFDTFEKEKMLERIKVRAKKMLEQGLIEETKKMYDAGFKHWAPMSSVGYLEVVEYLEGKISREHLEDAIALSTIQLVKKQKTWFQRDQSIHWQNVFNYDVAKFESLVSEFFQ